MHTSDDICIVHTDYYYFFSLLSGLACFANLYQQQNEDTQKDTYTNEKSKVHKKSKIYAKKCETSIRDVITLERSSSNLFN